MSVYYRIHTEDRENLPGLAAKRFSCFAVLRGVGYWQGIAEKAACIEVIGDDADREQVEQLARDIRCFNNQEAVYVTASSCTLTDIR